MTVRTRLAPSPTGEPHIGNFYSALLDFALAKKFGGQFILRIEDTDRARLVPGAEEKIYQALDWLKIPEDESPRKGGPFDPYRQSDRLALYQKYARELMEEGAAYPCFCTSERLQKVRKEQQNKGLPPKYDRYCLSLISSEIQGKLKRDEPHVIRLKMPDAGETSFEDLIRGKISFQNELIDDQILLKSDGFPTYHLANVVDDHLMEITHVIRAEEWISSTPKHILLYQAFDWKPPQFIHHPILRNPDQSKMSKRKNPTSVLWYRDQGFLPEALKNYLTHLGWTHPQQKDIYDFDEFLEKFDLKDLKTTAPIFDLQKLEWMNGMYIRRLDVDELNAKLKMQNAKLKEVDEIYLRKITALVQERMKKLLEFEELTDFFLSGEIKINPKLLVQKSRSAQQTQEVLKSLLALLNPLSPLDWRSENLEEICRNFVKTHPNWSTKDLFMTLRVAITGKTVSPPLFESLEVLGKERVLQRIDKTIKFL